MPDLSADGRLLLGTVGWDRDDWLSDCYPEDLPPEWRLAYYANDCGCVLLKADSWCGMDSDRLAALLDEAAGRLVFFLEPPAGGLADARRNLSLFSAAPAVLLVDRPDPGLAPLPQWVAHGPGVWVDSDSGASLVRWQIVTVDLRSLRARADALQQSVGALVLDGPAASPGLVPELRTMLELMGIA